MQTAASSTMRTQLLGRLACSSCQESRSVASTSSKRWLGVSTRNAQKNEASAGSAASAAPVYPFSDSVIFPTSTSASVVAPPTSTRSTTTTSSPSKPAPLSLMDRVNRSLILPNTAEFRGLFSRRGKDKIPPGSIVSVETYTGSSPSSPTGTASFAGLLMAVKHRHSGVDNAFRLRALIGKPGVGTEVRFDVNSPWIKSVKVLRRNEDARRAKLYYVRKDDKYLSGVQGAIRASIAAEAAATAGKEGGKKQADAAKSGSSKGKGKKAGGAKKKK